MQSHIPSIQTPRLNLLPLQPGDAAVLHRIYQEEGVLRYFPNPVPPPLDRVGRFIESQQAHWRQYGYGNWGISPAGETEIAGWAGLQYLPELDETEVGYLLGPRFWGMGYATEAARAALAFGLETCRLKHIIALVMPENNASRRVIEKCGMHYQETIHLWNVDLMRYRLDAPNL